MGSIANASSPFAIPPGQWSHIVIARNASEYINIYENGTFVESSYQPGTFDIADSMRIGSGSGVADTFFVDEFRESIGIPRL